MTEHQFHELQLKMPVPQSHKYENNLSQDIQLQVIIKENESLQRTKAKTSPGLMKKPFARAQDFNHDNIINVQYGKLKLNQSRDFRISPQRNNENSYGHHHPTSEKPENEMKCMNTTYFSESIRNIILEKHRIWKYLKWPLFLIFLCIFIGLVTCTYVNSLHTKPLALKCLNSSTNANCFVVSTTYRSELDVNSTFYNENPLHIPSQSEPTLLNKDTTEVVFQGSTTLLRPVIVPQLIQDSFREKNSSENGFKNDYTIVERKQNQEYGENRASTSKQGSYGQETTEKSYKDKVDTLNLLGFTSGHQNNFGIPIEEDERILRLLNEELIKLEQQTEPSSAVRRTESSVLVSPTVPLILHEVLESSTSSSEQSEEIQCQSTSLFMCRGVLQYDLTSVKLKNANLSLSDLKVFEQLFMSNCSARAAEFVCSALEPECRPTQTGNRQPCKRISILEACSSLIASSDILTYTFDCDKYPDSDDRNICEDPTRRKDCYENEFKCEDLSCIPNQWQCDNIKDCSEGEDELGCLICNPEEFRCRSNEKCLSDKYRCDMNEDCVDGSDERDCFSENNEDPQLYPRIFSFASYLLPNFTGDIFFTAISDEDRLASGSELNESLASAGGNNSFSNGSVALDEMQWQESFNNNTNITRNLANFQDSKEIMMTSDSENKLKISQTKNVTENNASQTEVTSPCIGDELRCVSGKCITVDQLCDKIMDCPEGEDELMCAYDERPQPKKPL